MSTFHCLQIGDANTDEVTIYRDAPGYPPVSEGLQRIQAADFHVWHNGLGYDIEAVNHFFPGAITTERLVDTLVLARMAFPEERNHSLKDWGARTGTFKGEYKGDYQVWDEEFELYARQDIPAGRALWHKVKHVREWGPCAEVEHRFARAMILQERVGVTFDVKKAEALDLILRAELDSMTGELAKTFPPLERTATFTPKVTLPKRGYIKGQPHTKRWQEAFNPSSRAHIAERLMLLGWEPKSYTESGAPTVDEKVLTALPYPEAKVLSKYFDISKRLGQLSEGKAAWLKTVKKDGKIHGRVNPGGTATGRASHSSPNLAQADKKDLRMRELFTARPGWSLVGIDAEGVQARFLGHYLARYDGGAYIKGIVEGDKKLKTDVHSLNVKAALSTGLIRGDKADIEAKWGLLRDGMKTAFYAKLFGASAGKMGTTMRQVIRDAGLAGPAIPVREMGALTSKALEKAIKGLKPLGEAVKAAAKTRGYLIGVDGRHIPVEYPHTALVYACQAGEAAVMKKAMCLFLDHAEAQGWKHDVDFAPVLNVHDEAQIECKPELAQLVGQAFADAIRDAGAFYNLRCPLAGAYDVGTNWASTH